MTEWVGCAVSIRCADGIYQGEIKSATNSDVILAKAFCDGIPCGTATILASDILDLKLLKKHSSPTAAGQSVVVIAKPLAKSAGRTQNLSESSTKPHHNGQIKSKPIDIQPVSQQQDVGGSSNSSNSIGATTSKISTTPNKRDKTKQRWTKGWKDEACFGSPVDQSFSKDFDFEKNLALFNKQAIFDEINSHRPDVVKHTDLQKKITKYRHDENVIDTVPMTYRQISVPKQDFCEYVTDEGLIIPSILGSLRKKLWDVADRIGLSWERRIELMGRGTTEMAIQLLGGAHRLNPHNSHQAPTVVLICGPNRQGAMGINAARQLASHGVNTIVYAIPSEASYVQQELSLYRLTKNKLVASKSALPNSADLIIVALSEDTDHGSEVYGIVSDWVNRNKAPVLAVDPPASGNPGIVSKFSIVPVLPLPHSIDNGKIYLCNLGFPDEIFSQAGIKYKSPFGAKFVIPLHPNDL